MLFGLPLDVILQESIDCQLRGRREHGCLGLRTPMGFAAVRMASEAILKVRDMVRTLRPVDYCSEHGGGLRWTLQFRRDSQKCSLMSSFTGVGWSWTELVESAASELCFCCVNVVVGMGSNRS
jgi:hypothetical protein